MSEIVALPGRVEGSGDSSVIEIEDVFTSHHNKLVRADGFPPHVDRFEAAGFNLLDLLAHERYDDVRVG